MLQALAVVCPRSLRRRASAPTMHDDDDLQGPAEGLMGMADAPAQASHPATVVPAIRKPARHSLPSGSLQGTCSLMGGVAWQHRPGTVGAADGSAQQCLRVSADPSHVCARMPTRLSCCIGIPVFAWAQHVRMRARRSLCELTACFLLCPVLTAAAGS
jgi:hypothetical protein